MEVLHQYYQLYQHNLESNLRSPPNQSHKKHLLQTYSDKHYLLFISSALLIKSYINCSVILS